MRYFIDTNVFLRVLVKEDERSFNECCQLLELIKTNKIKGVISSIILAEIVWTLSSYYKFSKQKVAQAVRSVINLRGLQIIDRFDHRQSLNFYEKKNVKYIDSLIASIKDIKEKRWIVVSYDKDFDKLEIVRKTPSEVI